MSVPVLYKNGFKGFVSEAVAKVLATKKQATIIKQAVAEGVDRAKLVSAAVKAGIAKTPDELDGMSDDELKALIEAAKK